MRNASRTLGAAALLALAACGGNAGDRAADNIETMTDDRADLMEDQADALVNEQAADALENRAENVRAMGENAAEAAKSNNDPGVENRVVNALAVDR